MGKPFERWASANCYAERWLSKPPMLNTSFRWYA